MDTSLIVGITSSIVAFISAILAVRATKSASNATIAHDESKEEDRKRYEIARFNEPLSVAVYELQSRIYNIICQNFIGRFYTNGSEREKRYVVENTAFVMSQYFCWTELVRREVQGSGYGKSLVNSEAIKQQDIINSVFGSDNGGRCLMIFAGEQRHLGEALIKSGPRGPECMGYREFMIERPPGVDYMLDQIRSDIRDLEARLADAIPRLLALHKALINYLDSIDPNYERFLQDRRQHILADAT